MIYAPSEKLHERYGLQHDEGFDGEPKGNLSESEIEDTNYFSDDSMHE